MKLSSLYITLILSAIISACSNSQDQKQSTDSTANDSQQSVSLDTNFYKKLVGTINETINITMDLVKTDSVFSGSYYYNKIGKPLRLSGHFIEGTNQIELIEHNELGNKTGTFTGSFDANNNFTGNWVNPETQKTMPFSLKPANTNNVVSATFSHYRNENCRTRDSLLKLANKENVPYGLDECSYIDISLITIETDNKEVSHKINKTILKDVCHDVGETQYQNVKDYLASIDHLSNEDVYEMDISCSITTNDKNILSVDVSNSGYTGGAHPNSWVKIYNFDLRNGNEIKLNDFLIEGGEQQLASIAEDAFEKAYGKDEWDYEQDKFPLAMNFNISTGGLYFIYNAYEIGSYAMGAPDVYIPYKDIKHLIKPNSIVAELMNK